jgi:hypothetical protein
MNSSLGSGVAIAMLAGAGCYHPPSIRAGHASLGSVDRTIDAPWGHERIADLERRGDELQIMAAERTYCRPFETGTIDVVDIQTAQKKNGGRPMQPWDMMLMIGGGAAALSFGIIPTLIDEPYEDGYLAGIGIGAAAFTIFGTVTIVGAALPNESRKEIPSQISGGRWSGPPAPCGEATAVAPQVQIQARAGEHVIGWQVPVATGERFAVPQGVADSLKFWSDACQVALDVSLRLSSDEMPPSLDRVRLDHRSDRVQNYAGSQSLESGVDAGAGHHKLFGTNEVRLRWSPGTRVKAIPADAQVSESARRLGEQCMQRAEGDFLKSCRTKVRDKHRPTCASKCAADGNATECTWDRDDCKAIGGSAEECTTMYDRCMAKKGLDNAGLQRCAEACLDDSAAVKEGNRQCVTDWNKR